MFAGSLVWLAFLGWLWRSSGIAHTREEAYIARAGDMADLERRIKNLDRQPM